MRSLSRRCWPISRSRTGCCRLRTSVRLARGLGRRRGVWGGRRRDSRGPARSAHHEGQPPGQREDLEGRQGDRAGVRLRIHLLRHFGGVGQMRGRAAVVPPSVRGRRVSREAHRVASPRRQAEDDQRLGRALRHAAPRLRQIPRHASGLLGQVPRAAQRRRRRQARLETAPQGAPTVRWLWHDATPPQAEDDAEDARAAAAAGSAEPPAPPPQPSPPAEAAGGALASIDGSALDVAMPPPPLSPAKAPPPSS